MLIRTHESSITLGNYKIFGKAIKFLTKEEEESFAIQIETLKNQGLIDIIDKKVCAFFIDNYNYYSGGRYSAWFFVRALIKLGYFIYMLSSETNPIYLDGIKDKEILKNIHISGELRFKTDIVFSLPMFKGIEATYYAEKYKIPLYLMIFETPNFIVQYKKNTYWKEEIWSRYKECLKKATKIIAPSELSKKYCEEWVGENCPPVEVICPCYSPNFKPKFFEKKNELTWIGREEKLKDLEEILPVISQFKDYTLNIVCKIRKDYTEQLSKENGIKINHLVNISDEEKYNVIGRSKVLLCPSRFEGFGMLPLEGVICGTKVIAKDLPVYKAYYGNDITYTSDWKSSIEEALQNVTVSPNTVAKYREKGSFEKLVNDVNEICFANMEAIIKDVVSPVKVESSETSIIIPVYNNIKYTKSVLDGLSKYQRGIKEVIVVDNNSTNNTKEFLIEYSKKWDKVKPLFLKENRGYPGGCNEGAKTATGEFLLFFNNDIIVQDDFANLFQDNWCSKTILGSRGVRLDENHKHTYDVSSGITYLEGWCLFIAKSDFEFLNGYDEQFGLGLCEDSDLCMRAKKFGFDLVYVESPLVHLGNTTLKATMEWSKVRELSDSNLVKLKDKWVYKDIFIKRKEALGDVLLTTPIVRAVKAKYPNSKITFFTYPVCKDVLVNNPYIDCFVTDDLESNYAKKADIKIDLVYENRLNRHIITSYTETAQVKLFSDKLDFFIYDNDEDYYKRFNLEDKNYIVVHTGKSWNARMLENDKFQTFLKWAAAESGLKIIEVGNNATDYCGFIDARGKTYNFCQLASIVKHSKYFIGIDSFPMHIAQAFQIPGIVPFVSIKPERRLLKSGKLVGIKNNLINYEWYNCLPHKVKVKIKVRNDITIDRLKDAFQSVLKGDK